jgi:lipopolysaccharide export system permease protein
MGLLDRYLIGQFCRAYLACFLSLLALYLVMDLFTKLDEFTESPNSRAVRAAANVSTETGAVPPVRLSWLGRVGHYYLHRLPLFFDKLSGMVMLMAAAFTLGWLERQNELQPILASGIPIRRLLWPVLAMILVLTGLGILNREYVIPWCAPHLLREAEDPLGHRPLRVQGGFDSNGVHIEGKVAYPQRKMIQHARITIPSTILGTLVHIHAKEIFYRPESPTEPAGWWLLGCTPEVLPAAHALVHPLGPGQFFLVTDLSYERLTRRPGWYVYQSTARLLEELQAVPACDHRQEINALLHDRLVDPMMTFVIVAAGVGSVMGRRERPLVVKMAWAGGTFLLIHGVGYACGVMARNEVLNASFAAWLPVMLFGPLALLMVFDIQS